MPSKTLFFTQPGCFSCELMRLFLDAKGVAFEEHDVSTDIEARRVMTEQHGSGETPTLVIFCGDVPEVIIGFDPARLDRLLDPAPSSDSVIKS